MFNDAQRELLEIGRLQALVAKKFVLVRTDPIVLKYHLTKVVEHWNIKPGDGYMYFTLRPPWVKAMANATYYALHPEQRMGAKR